MPCISSSFLAQIWRNSHPASHWRFESRPQNFLSTGLGGSVSIQWPKRVESHLLGFRAPSHTPRSSDARERSALSCSLRQESCWSQCPGPPAPSTQLSSSVCESRIHLYSLSRGHSPLKPCGARLLWPLTWLLSLRFLFSFLKFIYLFIWRNNLMFSPVYLLPLRLCFRLGVRF